MLLRAQLSLSTYAGIVPGATHWHCRVRWLDQEEDAQRRETEGEFKGLPTGRFNSEVDALNAGLRLLRRRLKGKQFVAFQGDYTTLDPQRCLIGHIAFKRKANILWAKFEDYRGWDAPKGDWPHVQKICDEWEAWLKEHKVDRRPT